MKERAIVLTGFMGAGKTTVGRELSLFLGIPFYDLDALIEAKHGPLPLIFKEKGEAYFRDLEVQTLSEIKLPAVISLGGGAFITKAVREWIKRMGVSIFLDWPFDVLLERVAGDPNRPLAADIPKMKALFEQRYVVYSTADFVWRPNSVVEEPRSIAQALMHFVSGT